MNLSTGTLLQGGKYKIECTLGQGGFGITYLAEQVMLGRRVAVKEFFMKELCERDATTSRVTMGSEGSRDTVNRYRQKFLKEARNIAKLNHPNIVRIIDIFEENGTAYYVMEYCARGSLADKVKQQGYMPEPVATRYILQVAEALRYVHQKQMNHLDVKPGNIMLNENDEAVLIDFGLSKQYDEAGQQTSSTPPGISEGYAPLEQYKLGGVGTFSPETDVYALGATFFKLLTGTTPPSASDVNNDGVPVETLAAKGVSKDAITVISHAMEGRKKDRMKSIGAFVEGLTAGTSSTSFTKEDTLLDVATETLPRQEIELKAREEEESRRKVEIELKTREEEESPRKSRVDEKSKKKMKSIALWSSLAVAAVAVTLVLALREPTSQQQSFNGVGDLNGHAYVDLGLPSGLLWATCNVGASAPGDYGDYFAWGETTGYNSGKTDFSWSTLKYCKDSSGDSFSKYVTNSSYGTVDNKTTLDSSDDIAISIWGEGWRMPTHEEWVELNNSSNCTWTWTTQDGHNGYKVTSVKNGNSIFLPAAGCRYGTCLGNAGSYGGYWSSSLYESYPYGAWYCYFDSCYHYADYYYGRCLGQSVRPVSAP